MKRKPRKRVYVVSCKCSPKWDQVYFDRRRAVLNGRARVCGEAEVITLVETKRVRGRR